MKSLQTKLLLFLVIAPMIGILFAGGRIYYSLKMWRYPGEAKEFVISPGENFSRINYRLKKAGLINSSKVFHRYSQWEKLLAKFKVGTYTINKGSSTLEIIELLTSGRGKTLIVTIPEGKNLFQVAKILKGKGIIKEEEEFVRLAKDPDFSDSLNLSGSRVEGYLYPETYHFSPGQPAKTIIKSMVNLFHKKTAQLKMENAPLDLSPHEVIILASVVEKETGAKHERPMIAGVFINRLKKRMRLQSDPTTIYGIWETFNGNLRKKHLLQKTPYNTYKIPALPRGPIANPGLASIQAVLKPASHSFLYFVSKNDGTHVFTPTYTEHKKAVDEYQRNRANRTGKSWRDLNKSKK